MKKLAIVLSAFLGGCTVGPKYQAPTVALPADYREQVPQEFKEAPGWNQGKPADSTIRPKWWELFNDTQLNGLEEQVDSANQTIKAAEARFRQARALIRLNRADLLPTITTTPTIVNQHISAAQSPLAGGGNTGGDFILPFDLSYEVDLWGKVRKTIEAAREEFQGTAARRIGYLPRSHYGAKHRAG